MNEGRCWFKYPFTQHEFHVAGLVTEPGAKTMRFSMWGFTLPHREWQVITVDFEKVLKRVCKFVATVLFTTSLQASSILGQAREHEARAASEATRERVGAGVREGELATMTEEFSFPPRKRRKTTGGGLTGSFFRLLPNPVATLFTRRPR